MRVPNIILLERTMTILSARFDQRVENMQHFASGRVGALIAVHDTYESAVIIARSITDNENPSESITISVFEALMAEYRNRSE